MDVNLAIEILDLLTLTLDGDITVPEEGRIVSNLCVQTKEKGAVMLRFYPAGCQGSKLESGFVDFEVEALNFLASCGIRVPCPLPFANGDIIIERNGVKIFAYQSLPGKCVKASDLSVDVARKCGEFLKESIQAAETYFPGNLHTVPEGDLDYIDKIFLMQKKRYPQIGDCQTLTEMHEFLADFSLHQQLKNTPKGIVHADFFFENIVWDEASQTIGAIDFGDAYYGYVVMDIVIGSMEFCVKEDRSWDLEMFQAFLEPHAEWLKKHDVPFDLFYNLLLANCLRFAIYTLPSTIEGNEALSDNPYVFRYNKLKETALRSALEARYRALTK